MGTLDIRANRAEKKYSTKENLMRILWSIFSIFFRFSPRPFFRWRRVLLRLFGARVAPDVNIYPSATIYMPWNLTISENSAIGEHAYIYNIARITVGRSVTISQRAHLCAGTHDYSDPKLPLIKMPIHIDDQAWICADSFIGPNVRIGSGAIVGACAVVIKDVEAWSIVAGNPAKFIKKRHIND